MSTSYRGQSIALLAQHGEERVLSEMLEPAVDCTVTHVTGFDTDQLDAFTLGKRSIGSQLEVARRKARVGMELSGLDFGLGSEGSFTRDPFTGTYPWNIELLVLLDNRQGIELIGMAQGPARDIQIQTGQWEALLSLAIESDFPNHQLILRPNRPDDHRIYKEIADWDLLRITFDVCRRLSDNGQVFVESDRRAFANPTRMARIGQAAQELARKVHSPCPVCRAPGYWVCQPHYGLSCSTCGLAAAGGGSEVWCCAHCSHRSARELTDSTKPHPRDR